MFGPSGLTPSPLTVSLTVKCPLFYALPLERSPLLVDQLLDIFPGIRAQIYFPVVPRWPAANEDKEEAKKEEAHENAM